MKSDEKDILIVFALINFLLDKKINLKQHISSDKLEYLIEKVENDFPQFKKDKIIQEKMLELLKKYF